MRGSLKILAIVVAVGLVGVSGELLANCNEASTPANYPVRQCITAAGTPSWFAAPPVGSGPVSATWWTLGFGNRPVVDPSAGANAEPTGGSGFITGAVSATNHGTWIGNDSGNLTVGAATGAPDGGLDLIPSVPGGPGSLCFSFGASWGLPFVDGCTDLNRTYGSLGGAGQVSDGYLNVYWSGVPGAYTQYSLVDSPMGVLLTEGSNKNFAAAFFSATSRAGSDTDIFDRGFDMGAIDNGNPNPSGGNDNVIPWQAIPEPNVSVAVDPNDESRIVSLSWSHIRLVHDGSSRLNPGATTEGTGRHVLGTPAPAGVGVLEQPELASYLVETKGIVGADCDAGAPWVSAGAGALVVPATALPAGSPLSTNVDVAPNSCVRLTTRLGRVPTQSMRTTGTASTNRTENRLDAQAGNFGDVGYQVSGTVRKIGEAFLSAKPVLRKATIAQKNLVVEFETLGEFEAQSFDIVAKDRKGNTTVIATVECSQCSSGIGAQYRVDVPVSTLRGASSVYVVMQPAGTASESIDITREGPTPGRETKRR